MDMFSAVFVAPGAIDWDAIGKMAAAAAIAGTGVSLAFGFAIRGFVGVADAREDDRPVAVVLHAVLGVVGLVGALAAVYLGFRVVVA